MFTAVTVERHRLADSLDALTEAEWNTASLCLGWRVRDVVGHLVSILEVSTGQFMLNVVKARGFNAYADRVARATGDREPKELLTAYRTLADTRFAPPLVGPIAPLADVLVHTLDIERPLGRRTAPEPTAVRAALDYVCGGRAYGFVPTKRTKGLRFEATDLDWSTGSGPTVTGDAADVLLAATGRPAALEGLSGDGVPLLRARLG